MMRTSLLLFALAIGFVATAAGATPIMLSDSFAEGGPMAGSSGTILQISPLALRLPLTNDELRTQVAAYKADPAAAEAQYGPIGNWDTSAVTDMSKLFYKDFSSFNADIGKWQTAAVTDMHEMFYYAKAFDQDIGKWDTSAVEDMHGMFSGSSNFNQYIGDWDLSNLVDMKYMFYKAAAFNQDIGNWKTAKVTNMRYLFFAAANFNQDIRRWCTNKVTDLDEMINGADAFSYRLPWDTSSVPYLSYMIGDGAGYDAVPSLDGKFGWLVTTPDYCNCNTCPPEPARGVRQCQHWCYNHKDPWSMRCTWDTHACSGCDDCDGLYTATRPIATRPTRAKLTNAALRTQVAAYNADPDAAEAKYGPIGTWDTSGVTDMSYLFNPSGDGGDGAGADHDALESTFNGDIGEWDTSMVTNMEAMFSWAENFNQDISGWDTSSVTNMKEMFSMAIKFNADLSAWDVSEVSTMYAMFNSCHSFNQDIGGWCTAKVTNMSYMFNWAKVFRQHLPWDTSSLKNKKGMFSKSGYGDPPRNEGWEGWSRLTPTDCSNCNDCPPPPAPPAPTLPTITIPTFKFPTFKFPTFTMPTFKVPTFNWGRRLTGSALRGHRGQSIEKNMD